MIGAPYQPPLEPPPPDSPPPELKSPPPDPPASDAPDSDAASELVAGVESRPDAMLPSEVKSPTLAEPSLAPGAGLACRGGRRAGGGAPACPCVRRRTKSQSAPQAMKTAITTETVVKIAE